MRLASRQWLVLLIFVAVAMLAMTACEPCPPLSSCRGQDYLAAEGQVVDTANGQGLDGIRIDMIRTGGIGVAQDSVSAVTAGGGFWHVEFQPMSSGALVTDVVVTPLDVPSYRLHGITLQTRNTRGDANLNERWVTALYFEYVGEFYLNATNQPADSAQFIFRQTGGPPLVGPGIRNGTYTATTDRGGRVYLFATAGPAAVHPTDDAEVVGTVTVKARGQSDSTLFTGLRLRPSHTTRDRGTYPPVFRSGIGP